MTLVAMVSVENDKTAPLHARSAASEFLIIGVSSQGRVLGGVTLRAVAESRLTSHISQEAFGQCDEGRDIRGLPTDRRDC
jgi:hypothetical protein